ncbi:MAG: hypothetical protein AAGD86_06890 [Pseudomonadota bacterium]
MAHTGNGWQRENILAFVHIEKAAGTSLIHILRRNFFLRYLDVRPLSTTEPELFTARDMRRSLKVNPLLRCIAGHAVKPWGDLEREFPQVRYITLLRDPVARYVSQYKYWTRVLRKDWSFGRFLDHEKSYNFQTRKLVGSDDADAAFEMLATRFLAVGIVERFDEFLMLLGAALAPRRFDPRYAVRNAEGDNRGGKSVDVDAFAAQIAANNASDLRLYARVRDELLPAQHAALCPDLEARLGAFRAAREPGALGAVMGVVDGVCRKAYYEPVTGLVRRLNDLPATGSY